MLTIYYHRDFDGIAAAAILAHILTECRSEPDLAWRGVNHDIRARWETFGRDEDFAVVDFFFHPRAAYWFDHHPTTFIREDWQELYEPSETRMWDASSYSCPPVILAHATRHWGYEAPARFEELRRWSDKIDAARFDSVEEVLFGDAPALRIMRSLTVAPSPSWSDRIVAALIDEDLAAVAASAEIEKRHQRACSNREKALLQFPPTVMHIRDSVLMYDASSNNIRRERFAPFYHHPEIHYAVGIIPTRGGLHITAGENPWNPPQNDIDVGAICTIFGGGGHKAVGGVNPESPQECRLVALEITRRLRAQMRAGSAHPSED